MKLFLMFEVDDLNQAQKVIGAVGALGIKPSDMRYSLPTPAKKEEIKTLGELEAENPEGFCNPGFEEQVRQSRPNVSPGEPSIGKIGGETKARLLGSMQDHDMSPDFNGGKFLEHLKLLWKRGEIKFDGTVFYV